MGKEFSHSNLEVIGEKSNYIKIKAGNSNYIIQFQESGTIMMTKEGGIPLIYKRGGP